MKAPLSSNGVEEINLENPPKRRINLMLASSVMLWLLLVCCGLWIVWSYESAPGAAANPPSQWPADSQIQRASGQATLIMLAHPHCPCTRATIGELALLMAQAQGRVKAYVLFLKPQGYADEWAKTDLWQSAAQIPNVNVVQDENGIEAARFHAATSGQTLLYDATGRLAFSGGITSARGHSGDNAGRSAIVALLIEGKAEQTATSVYGCQLFNTNTECHMRESNHATSSH
jgi:hypothetical protein